MGWLGAVWVERRQADAAGAPRDRQLRDRPRVGSAPPTTPGRPGVKGAASIIPSRSPRFGIAGVDWASRIGPRHPLTSSRDLSSWASWLRDRTSSFVKTFLRW